MIEKDFSILTKKTYDLNAERVQTLSAADIPVLLYGHGKYSELVRKFLNENNVSVAGYVVDKEYYTNTANLYSTENIDRIFKGYYIVFCIDIRTNKSMPPFKNAAGVFFLKFKHNDSDNIDAYYVKNNLYSFRQTYEWLCDDFSKHLLYAYLNSKINNDAECMIDLCTFPQYFSFERLNADIVKIGTFIDCGAFDGDTLIDYSDFCNGEFVNAICFEPDNGNFMKLQACAEKICKKHNNNSVINNILLINKAASAKVGTVYFNETNDSASCIVQSGNCEIETDLIDNYTKDYKTTFIKADIEGSELSALSGAEQTIKRDKPTLAICVYHKKDDLITIPQYIKSLVPNYKFYLRLHSYIGRELVLYAIP